MTLTTIQWISLAIVIAGIVMFLYFVFRKHDFRKKVVEEVEEYKETVKELVPELKASKKKKEEDEDDSSGLGLGIADLIPLGISLVVFAVVISFGLQVLNDVQSSFTADSANYNTSAEIETLSQVSDKLPVIGMMVVAIIIINILVKALEIQGKY